MEEILFTHENYRKKGLRMDDEFDISVTLCKGGRIIRFGFRTSVFINKLRHLTKYVQISNAARLSTRIYFIFSDQPDGECYRIQRTGKKNGGYIYMTPSGDEATALKKYWGGNLYQLQYDAEKELFYIERPGKTLIE